MNLVVEIRKTNPSPQKPQGETKHTHTQWHRLSRKQKRK